MKVELLKDRIMILINSNKPYRLDIRKIADKLGMEGTADFIMLNKALNSLEEEYVLDRNEDNCFASFEKSGLVKGVLRLNRKGFGFVDDENGKDSYYITPEDMHNAIDQDEVIIRAVNTEGCVLRIVKRNRNHIIGTVHTSKKGKPYVILDDDRFSTFRCVLQGDAERLTDGLKVRFRIIRSEVGFGLNSTLYVEVDQIIGHINDPGIDVAAILLDHDIIASFNEDVMKEVKKLPYKVTEADQIGRVDLRELFTCTIDGDDSKDFDDAVSVKKEGDTWRLWVHIADVSYYVKEGSAIDKEALRRGTSTYVCDRVVNMLPQALSNGICSLNPDIDRCALTCEMVIDGHGEITDYELYPSLIHSDRRMTYRKVNEILADTDTEYQDIASHFITMKELADVIRARREGLGAIDFDRDEAAVICDKKGKPVDVVLRDRGAAEMLIEDFMVTANECVARHMKYLEYPCLYRIHEAPDARKMREFVRLSRIMGHAFKGNVTSVHPKEVQECLNSFKDSESYPVISTLMLRTMAKARYDARCLGHFGLGLDEYLHFTSPIRRYPDLIVHRMLRKYCFEGRMNNMDRDISLMDEYAMSTSESERRSVEAEREVTKMKMAEYMEGHIGEVFEATVSGVAKFGMFVQLPNLVEGLVRVESLPDYFIYDSDNYCLYGTTSGVTYSIGQSVKVKCVKADKATSSIDFEVLKKAKKKRQGGYKWERN